jgi:glycyl-tRNA synthetase beta chain
VTLLLLEIGCEELPGKICASVYKQLTGDAAAAGLVAKLLRELRLAPPAASGAAQDEARDAARPQVLISPRRIAVLVDVPDRQIAETQRSRGPRVDMAFGPDGAPTKAGAGFARSRGLDPKKLERETFDGVEFVVAQVEAERRAAAEVVPEFARRLITGIQISRGMRWDRRPAGADEYLRFSRPIRWLACKLHDTVVDFAFYGIRAGEVTQGHRVLGSPIIIDKAEHYARHLRDQKVIVAQDERRALIVAGLDARAKELGGEWFDPGAVLEEAIYLVEWPSVHKGAFGARHLRLPADVLITAMQSHQRYFPLRDAQGKLLPAFLYVSNGDPAAAAIITRGNERVLDGRLDDAEFSHDRDVAEGLEQMAAKLGDVVFHEKLGSLADKAARIERLVGYLVGDGDKELGETALQAARLAKADLVSQMVQEFPSLQGRMGAYFATAAGLPAAVAQAIAEQYLPVSAVAPVPASLAGAFVAIADKADSIAGAWVAGEKPSGSRDPYGLRRAAIGIVRIALEFALRVPLAELMERALDGYRAQGRSVAETALPETVAFVWERLEGLLLDEGLPFALVEAALGSSAADIPARAARARAFAALAGRDHFDAVVAAYNRCASLAGKAQAAQSAAAQPAASGAQPAADPAAQPIAPRVDPALFRDPAETALHAALAAAEVAVGEALGDLETERAIRAAAALRAPVDAYFDAVLVMDADLAVRANRLAQLAAVIDLLGQIGDFGRLPVQQAV